MSQSSSFSVGVSILGLLNIFLFIFHWWGHGMMPKNSSNCILISATEVLQVNGRTQIKDVLKKNCGKLGKEDDFPNALRRAMEETIEKCNKNPNREISRNMDSSLLTLFTTWPADKPEWKTYENTVINWSFFIPKVNLVLFSNKSEGKSLASDRGWVVYPEIPHPEGRAPVLRTMFKTVMSKFNSTFYGYAKGNLLFSGALIDSLNTISSKFEESHAMLITGRRHQVENVTLKELTSLSNIQLAAKSRGQLTDFGENYLITTKSFPWDSIPDLVADGPDYGRFLVSRAICTNITVVDTSSTLVAVEQSTSPLIESKNRQKEVSYNKNIIKKLNVPNVIRSVPYDCADWATYETFCGGIDIGLRDDNMIGCTCRY